MSREATTFYGHIANEAFENLASKGWRVWVEHVDTGERIAESSAEKQYLTQ